MTPTNLALVSITSSGNWNWNWDGVPSTAGTLNYSQPWYPPSYPPHLQYNQLGFMPFADVTNYLSSQFHRDPYLYAEPSSFPGVVDRSTSYAVPSSSDAVPSSSDAVPSSSDAVPPSSDAVPSSTDAVPSSCDAVPSNSDAVPTSNGVSEPFILKRLNGRIKVCAGCKGPHVKSADNGLLFPPSDMFESQGAVKMGRNAQRLEMHITMLT